MRRHDGNHLHSACGHGEGLRQSTQPPIIPDKFKALTMISCLKDLTSCDPSIPPEEFLGPLGPQLERELKMGSGAFQPLGPKS